MEEVLIKGKKVWVDRPYTRDQCYAQGFKDGWDRGQDVMFEFVEKCTSINVNKLRKELNDFCNADEIITEKRLDKNGKEKM